MKKEFDVKKLDALKSDGNPADLGKDRFIEDFNSCFRGNAKMKRFDESQIEIRIGTVIMRFPLNPLPNTFLAYSVPEEAIVW